MTPVPQEIHDRAELLARVHDLKTVAEIMGKHPSCISKMRRRGWKAADYSSARRPVPTDFTIQFKRLTYKQLCSHYQCSTTTLTRWRRELAVRK